MKELIPERIANVRTDLVFDPIGAGVPATSAGSQGVPLIRMCARYGDVMSAIRFLLDNFGSQDAMGENFDVSRAT